MEHVEWEFLRPWCEPLRGRLRVESTFQPRVPSQTFSALRVRLDNQLPSSRLTRISAALVILSLAAHVEPDVFLHALVHFCGLDPLTFLEAMDDENFGACFVLEFGEQTSGSSGVPVSSFFTWTENPRTDGFIETVQRITAMDPKRVELGVDIPLCVSLDPSSTDANAVYHYFRDVWNALAAIKAKFAGYRIPICLAPQYGVPTDDGGFEVAKCAFVLEAIELGDAGDLSRDMAMLLDEIITTGDGLLISRMMFTDRPAANSISDGYDAAQAYGDLTERALCHASCARRAHIQELQLDCVGITVSRFARLCSAIAESRSTPSLGLMFGSTVRSPGTWRWFWEFLAYAIFSKHSHANISDLLIQCVSLTNEDVDAMMTIQYADNPTWMLFGRNQYESADVNSVSSPDEAEQLYTLDKYSPVSPQPMYLDGSDISPGTTWRLGTELDRVRLVNDDGVSVDSDVLVPGYGLCKAPRRCIKPMKDHSLSRTKVTTLSVMLDSGAVTLTGLLRFFGLFGSSLTYLSVEASGVEAELHIHEVLKSCPKLKSLCVSGIPVDTAMFLETYNGLDLLDLSELDCNFADLGVLMSELANPRTNLAQRLNRLSYSFPDSWDRELEDQHVRDVTSMLAANRRIEYLRVNVSSAEKRKHLAELLEPFDGISLPVQAVRFPLDCCLAFLSVVSPVVEQQTRQVVDARSTIGPTAANEGTKFIKHEGHQLGLDHYTQSTIFAFAATRTYRRVYVQ